MSTDRLKYYSFLHDEQKSTQQNKERARSLGEYNQYLLPGRALGNDFTTEVEDFLESLYQTRISNLDQLIELLRAKKSQPVEWVDMGGGYATAMREFATSEIANQVKMTNVDLYDEDAFPLSDLKFDLLQTQHDDIHNPAYKPNFIHGNIETIKLSQPADLITNIEVIQYLNNPLAAICNWYNQLAPGGILLVAAEHRFSNLIRYPNAQFMNDPHPLEQLITALTQHHIQFSVSDGPYKTFRGPPPQNGHFKLLAIQKKPGTSLFVSGNVMDITQGRGGYKVVFYQRDGELITVTNEDDPRSEISEKYYQILNRVLLGTMMK
jgi:SAM-dependent methyltransferase